MAMRTWNEQLYFGAMPGRNEKIETWRAELAEHRVDRIVCLTPEEEITRRSPTLPYPTTASLKPSRPSTFDMRRPELPATQTTAGGCSFTVGRASAEPGPSRQRAFLVDQPAGFAVIPIPGECRPERRALKR